MILPGAERLRTIAERLAALDVAQTAIAAEQRALLDELRRVAGEAAPAEGAPYGSPARKLMRAKAAAGDLKISERTLCRWLAKFPGTSFVDATGARWIDVERLRAAKRLAPEQRGEPVAVS